ncbi:MAG: hypothetical protein IKS48_12475 [Eubacterium sp.]|nr:hypothetical protein [Eubacterium sp.]
MKAFLKACVISLIFNGAGFVLNLLLALADIISPLGIPINGGECDGFVGFGIQYMVLYPLTNDPSDSGIDSMIEFEPFTLIIGFIIVFVIAFIVLKKRGE